MKIKGARCKKRVGMEESSVETLTSECRAHQLAYLEKEIRNIKRIIEGKEKPIARNLLETSSLAPSILSYNALKDFKILALTTYDGTSNLGEYLISF